MAFTQKQIEKFQRQKYINQLEKTAKNIFRMLRDATSDAKSFTTHLQQLKKKLDPYEEVRLNTEYHQQLQAYITRLHKESLQEDFDTTTLHRIREAEMSNLNRLQKLKNATSYKKDKHKSHHKNEEWS
jgi:NAD-specific glutamate dehydrogenase